MRFNAKALRDKDFLTRLDFHVPVEGHVAAAVNARLIAGAFTFVEILWVDDAHRGKGLGSALLTHVEEETKRRGGTLIYLDTYSFQAPKFYEKLGYRVFGTLDEIVPGHAKYFLSKTL